MRIELNKFKFIYKLILILQNNFLKAWILQISLKKLTKKKKLHLLNNNKFKIIANKIEKRSEVTNILKNLNLTI